MLHIAILGNVFVSWGGGIDCLKLYINALLCKSQATELKIYLLIPEENRFIVKVKNRLRPFKKMLIDISRGKYPHYVIDTIDEKVIMNSFNCFDNKINIVFYTSNKMGLIDALKKINADVVIPAFESLGSNFPYPWVGYLYDFQHKYYPEFFTDREIDNRNRAFSNMLNDAKAVIVNALDVKNDILKYYPEAKARVFNLPFSPVPRGEWLITSNTIKEYKLPQKYFIISNQFWIHKSHSTAFEALAILKNQGICDYKIVCTGNTYDYRFPNYFGELNAKIAQLGLTKDISFLGYITKDDQIQIMRNSVAVLQPTLFEGGPGGGAVYDAVALGIPAIVSDIPVNREIGDESILFFNKSSAEDMANQMLSLIKKYENKLIKRQTEQELLEQGRIRLEILGKRLFDSVEYVLNSK